MNKKALMLATAAAWISLATLDAEPSRPAPAPNPHPDEGAGPYKRLVIRGATLIDGTGAPPVGPVDIVIENDRIAAYAVFPTDQ